MKLDILAFGVHPDDVEMSCAGTIISHIKKGYQCGIIDLTRGELGTRGSAEQRDIEAINAAKILGVSIRENLGMQDGFFRNDQEHQIKIIEVIRRFKPEIIFCNAVEDRHPDHGRSAELVYTASFLSGLIKVKTYYDGIEQEAHRPRKVYHYIQDRDLKPNILVDISETIEIKMNSIKAYTSQFYNPNSNEPSTYISSPEFLNGLKGRLLNWGKLIGVNYAEGFTSSQMLGVKNIIDLL
jgi:bacillithiol biosynthesis deacetylase BshB1